MAKIDYQFYNFEWNNYLVQNKYQTADFGSRLAGKYQNLDYGSSVILESVSEPEHLKYNVEIDAQYNLMNFIKIKQQLSKLDQDYKYFGYLVPEKSWSISVLKNIKPYAGYNYAEAGQNVIGGINLQPIDGAFIKLEYNKDVANSSSEQIDLQVGYSF